MKDDMKPKGGAEVWKVDRAKVNVASWRRSRLCSLVALIREHLQRTKSYCLSSHIRRVSVFRRFSGILCRFSDFGTVHEPPHVFQTLCGLLRQEIIC
jgi:hypothetical protein